MYNFIVNLFTEKDYNSLLNENDDKTNKESNKILVIPSNFEHSPFIVNSGNMAEELDEYPILSEYNRKELLEYFQLNKFINPTHNNKNNIGSNSAFMSHSPTHYKVTNSFLKKDEQNKDEILYHQNENVWIEFSQNKIDAFEKSVKDTDYYTFFHELCEQVINFFKNFDNINPDNDLNLDENDYIVILIESSEISDYIKLVQEYTIKKILRYEIYEGICDSCGSYDKLFMLTQGNLFDLGKGRKYLLRHPTRYKTNLTSESPENYNVCSKCAKQVYNFFEYIKKYKFYRYVFPTNIAVYTDDYKNYSSESFGILRLLNMLYHRNRFQEFDYIMFLSDPKLENIEFRYIINFNYNISNQNPSLNIRDIPISSTIKELKSKGKENEIVIIHNKRNKAVFLMELNLIFNNTLSQSLFENDPNKLIKSLHPFIKLKIIEYNSIIRNYIFFQDLAFFEDKVFSKLFKEILSELIINPHFRDEMKIGTNKIRFFLTIYYKYLNLEPGGGNMIRDYLALKEKFDNLENIDLENDFEASYFMGQIFYYLLQISESMNKLELFTKYSLNVHNMEVLKKRLITVLEKYSHNEYIDNNRKFRNLIKNVLSFEFRNSYEDNKIPLYTGYFDNNYLYGTKKEKEKLEIEKVKEE